MAPESCDARSGQLLQLPEEILEHILKDLDPRDLARAVQTCHALKNLSLASPTLQYADLLKRSGYLDVQNRPRAHDSRHRSATSTTPIEGTSDAPWTPTSGSPSEFPALRKATPVARASSPFQSAIKSPHTGLVRPTLSTVSLAPWPATPPTTRQDLSALSVVDKTKALNAREDRWAKLEPAQVRTFHVKGRTGVYELQEGIFLVCEDVTGQLERPSTIRLIPLPSVADPDLDDPPIPTKAHTVPFAIADLTMDPSQDLVVVSEHEPAPARAGLQAPAHRYHLLTMSTFEPHPLASVATLDFPPASGPSMWPRQLLQVMGDTLITLVSREGMDIVGTHNNVDLFAMDIEEEMVAWNWKTGEVLARIHFGGASCESTFVMLTPTSVAVAQPGQLTSEGEALPPMIQIYSFMRSPTKKSEAGQPLKMDHEDRTTSRAILTTRLLMPPLADEFGFEQFHVRPDPPFPPVGPKQATLGRGKPFTLDPSRGLLVFEIAIKSPERRALSTQRFYELFVLRETLVEMAVAGEERVYDAWKAGIYEPGLMDVLDIHDWEDWGEPHARLMPQFMNIRRHWVCSCAGYRFASLKWADNSDTCALSVHDFNPDIVARDRARARAERKASEAKTRAQVQTLMDFARAVDEGDSEDGGGGESSNGHAARGGRPPAPMTQAEREATLFNRLSSLFARHRSRDEAESGATTEVTATWTETSAPTPDGDRFGEAQYTVQLYDEPTILDTGGAWEDEVVSRLPFRTITRTVARGNRHDLPDGVMIDDQRIIVGHTLGHGLGEVRQKLTILCM